MDGRVQLVLITGPQRGAVFAPGNGESRIGRGETNNFDIQDLTVSRSHCVVRRIGDRLTVRDMGSINGTFVNEVPVSESAELQDGDELKLGDSRFLVYVANARIIPEFSDSEMSSGAIGFMPTAAVAKIGVSIGMASSLRDGVEPGSSVGIRAEFASIAGRALGASRVAFVDRSGLGGVITLLDSAGASMSPTVMSGLISEATPTRPVVHRQLTIESTSVTLALAAVFRNGTAVGAICVEFPGTSGVDSRTAAVLQSYCALAAATGSYGLFETNAGEPRNRETSVAEGRCNMIGDSHAMQTVYNFIARIARTDSTVVVTGESGTGKELAARSIHARSDRREGPFVALNCATLSENLLESELFGYEKGAFTGALKQKKGKVEIANGGVLFLDELGELSTALQPKLLRFLQEREFERVGGTVPIRVDVRIVAATNCDLPELVATGQFRSDLFYRLMVCHMKMPSLRDRTEDIPLLADYFVRRCSERVKRRVYGITSAAMAMLQLYAWPGNVRELENTIERAIVLGQSDSIQPEDLPLELASPATAANGGSFRRRLEQARREIVLDAFARAKFDHAVAAGLLQIHPNNLHRVIRSLNLQDSIRAAKVEAPVKRK